MKTAIIILIVTLIKQLIGSDNYSTIEDAVKEVDDTQISGSDKHEAVILAVEEFLEGVSSWLINLAIEAAVAKLRA